MCPDLGGSQSEVDRGKHSFFSSELLLFFAPTEKKESTNTIGIFSAGGSVYRCPRMKLAGTSGPRVSHTVHRGKIPVHAPGLYLGHRRKAAAAFSPEAYQFLDTIFSRRQGSGSLSMVEDPVPHSIERGLEPSSQSINGDCMRGERNRTWNMSLPDPDGMRPGWPRWSSTPREKSRDELKVTSAR